jgi:CBS domain-containing protein
MSKPKLVREFMTEHLVTLKPDMPIFQAILLLIKNKVSGAPVVDDLNRLLGILSEKDCLSIFANEAFYSETAGGEVADYMTTGVSVIDPDDEVFKAADIFLKNSFRRLPVVDDGILVGQISRRDVLMASLHIVEESPKKKAWTDACYITDEVKALLASPREVN